jgi:citrate lyase subunit beta/citryl-CoA lyase
MAIAASPEGKRPYILGPIERNTVQPRRAVLVAPASDERKARKALASRADEVVLDLEDAVTPERKDSARKIAVELVREFGVVRPVSIRINSLLTDWAADDLEACADFGPELGSVVVPKVESPEQIREVIHHLGDSTAGIQALLETPRGILAATEICTSSDRLQAVILGYADLAATLGRSVPPPQHSWNVVQDLILLAARAAGVAVVDGPHLTIVDDDGFRSAKVWVRDLGFDGTWVIHPAQIEGALEAFTPGATQIADARRVLAALEDAAARGAGAAELDGRMLDEALAVSARRVLSKAGLA